MFSSNNCLHHERVQWAFPGPGSLLGLLLAAVRVLEVASGAKNFRIKYRPIYIDATFYLSGLHPYNSEISGSNTSIPVYDLSQE